MSIPFTMENDPWTDDLANVNSPEYETAKNLVLNQLNLTNPADLVPGVTVLSVDVTFRPINTTAVVTNQRFLCMITLSCVTDAIAVAVMAVVSIAYHIDIPICLVCDVVMDIGTAIVDVVIDAGQEVGLLAGEPGTSNFR